MWTLRAASIAAITVRVAVVHGQSASTAVVTSPANGAVDANLTQPIQWTSVSGAQSYYLYVGSTLGAKDLVNTGEIQSTSYTASGLPRGVALYARLWTKLAGLWAYSDSQFAADAAALTYPANGARNADLRLPIQWTPIAAAQAYYLYVGSALGAKDLLNTGEIQSTSYTANGLPRGVTLYARLWTRVAGLWIFTDSQFRQDVATLTYPLDGTTNADLRVPLQWTPVPGADCYYLYVGTTRGAADLINSGEIHTTSYAASTLPRGQTLYARLWTKMSGAWNFTDTTFAADVATITYPADGSTSADFKLPIQWTPVAGVQAYYLYVGSTAGAKDLVDTGEIQTTSYLTHNLPSAKTLYARLWTKLANQWSYADSTFTSNIAALVYPTNGAVDVDVTRPIEWTPIPAAQAYYLYVGSSLGAKDLINSGEIQTTTYSGASLPRDRMVYVRMWTKRSDTWSWSDSTFTARTFGPLVRQASLVRVGAFRVPGGLHSGGLANAGFEYGGTAIGYNPANDSLFMVGHNWDQFLGEISTPPAIVGPINSLATAALLQPLVDPLEGRRNLINPTDPNSKVIGGTLPTSDSLIITAYSYYDGLNTQSSSHFRRSLNLSVPSIEGPFSVGLFGAGFVSGYMALVPAPMQAALGGPTLTGQGAIPIISRTSYGPGVGSFDPANFNAVTRTPWQPLVAYPQAHTTLGGWNQSNPLFGGADQVNGVVVPTNTSTVLFFGRHGDVFCYGDGTSDATLAGLPAGDGNIWCYDPTDGSKGVHGYPYHSYVWAYNVNDLITVRAGSKAPWDVVPYAVWQLPDLNGSSIGGAAYDPASGRIFVSQLLGDDVLPLIHVYRVSPPQ
jgi:hypothetical protein